MADTRGPLTIEAVDVIPVHVPRTGVFNLQRGPSDAVSPFTVVRLRTREGVVGYGESVTRARSLHRVLTDHLLDAVVGHDAFDVLGLHRRVDEIETLVTERREHWSPIRAALDMASYDLQGKWLGLPVHRLLGGAQRDRVETVKNVGVGTPQEAAETARRYADVGYRLIKVRVGRDPALDLARLAAVREAVPDGVRIRVDANEAWDAVTAIRQIDRMSAFGLESAEQPCKHWDLAGSARVAAATNVPIVADESVWSLGDAANLLRAGAADVLHLYLGKSGGIYPAMQTIATAEALGGAVTIGERVPLGISEAAHLHVAAATRRLDYPCALSYDLNESNLLTSPTPRDGAHLLVPDGSGLGVEVDTDKLEFYRLRTP
jgi:L-alanine-DL-glutamate epimerase-like enolase superfamily enzyme